MSFPAYLWSDVVFHTHRLHYWYVVNALTPPEEPVDSSEDPTEAYYEIYSDY